MATARKKAALFLVAVLCFLGNGISYSQENQGETHEIEKGFSSSYLPLKDGPHVNKAYRFDKELLSDQEMNLTQRFDEARKRTLHSGGQEFISLFDFIKDIGFDDKAQGWEGKCHQWSAAASDKNVKKLLSSSKGLICKGIILENKDLKELFTGLYPSKSTDFYGSREGRPEGMGEEEYQINTMLKAILGQSDFSPQLFHEKAHALLKEGQGFVLDVDPGEQVWNHPVYKIDSHSKIFQGDIPTEASDIPSINFKYLEGKNQEAEDALAANAEIEAVFEIVMATQGKSSTSKLGPILAQAGFTPVHTSELLKDSLEGDFGEALGKLTMFKLEVGQKAIKAGLRVKAPYRIRSYESKVKFLVETGFRDDGTPEAEKSYMYSFVEKAGPQGEIQIVDSQWSEYAFIGGDKPDFLWVPECVTQNCHREADRYKRSRLFQRMSKEDRIYNQRVGLIIGLSDLLKLFQQCFPLDKGIAMTQELVKTIERVKSQPPGLLEEDKNLLLSQFKAIKDSALPLNLESLNQVLAGIPGVRVSPEGNLIFEQ